MSPLLRPRAPQPSRRRRAPRYARIMGVGGYRPSGSSPTPRSSRRSTPPTSGSGSGPASSAAASPPPRRPSSTCPRPRPARRSSDAGLNAAPDRRASSSPPSRTPTRPPPPRPMLADRLGAIQRAAFDISAACAGYCHGIALANDMVRGGSRRVRPRRRRREALATSPTRTTAARPSSSATARARPSSARPRPRPSARPSGARTARSGRPSRSADSWRRVRATSGRRTGRPSRMAGQSVFRWAVWGMAPVAQQALDAAGVTRRRPRRLHPAPGEHADHRRDDQAAQAARRTSPSRATSPRPANTSRRLDPARHRAACCARARCPAAASPCRSASARGWCTPRRSSSCPRTRLPPARG